MYTRLEIYLYIFSNVCISIGRLIGFLIVRDICNEATCPEMKADQWQYLCASHAQPNSVIYIMIIIEM